MINAGAESRLVIVALDGSPAAAAALPLALAMAEQLRARVKVLHARHQRIPETQLRRELGLGAEHLSGIEIVLDIGDAAMCILRATDDPRVQALVMTTHGRLIEEGRKLGSVAAEVIARTTEPVLLVRPEAPPARGPLKRLLLPLDGTPRTARALTPATDLACELGASVDLLYVAAPKTAPEERGSIRAPKYVDQTQHEWPDWATEIAERLCACAKMAPAVPLRVFLSQGEVGTEIARFAREHEHDAIVLVRRSHLEPGRARVLRAVLDVTSCPILLVGAPSANNQSLVEGARRRR